MLGILELIKTIISVFLTVYDSLIDFIVNTPKFLDEAIQATGGVFSIFSAFYANIPDKMWLAILISSLGIFFSNFLYGKLNNNKGGA